MAYDSTTRKLYVDTSVTPNIGISLDEIAECIRDYRVDSARRRDLGMLALSPNINSISKIKPHASAYADTFGWSLSAVDGDLGNEVTIEYHRPTDEYKRILDFDGYKHTAVSHMNFKRKLYTNNTSNGAFVDDNDTDSGVGGTINTERFLVIKTYPLDEEGYYSAHMWNCIDRGDLGELDSDSLTLEVAIWNPDNGAFYVCPASEMASDGTIEYVVSKDVFDTILLRGNNMRVYYRLNNNNSVLNTTWNFLAPMRYATISYNDGLIFDLTSNISEGTRLQTLDTAATSIVALNVNPLIVRSGVSLNITFTSLLITNKATETLTNSSLFLGVTMTLSDGTTKTFYGRCTTFLSVAGGAAYEGSLTFNFAQTSLASNLSSSSSKSVRIRLYTLGNDIFGTGEPYFGVGDYFPILMRLYSFS